MIFILFAGFVSAAIEVDSNDLTIPVDYGNLRNDENKIDVSRGITLTNSGNASENLSFSLNLQAGYNLAAGSSLTLAAGASQDLTLSGKIPVTADQGIHEIGTLAITSSTGSQTHTLKTNVKNMLEIDEINVFVDGNDEKSVESDGEDVENLEPGETVQLRFRLKNLFDDNYDEGDIDGEITLVLDDDDFDEEVDEDTDFTLEAGEKLDSKEDEIVLEFSIPQQAKAGDYQLEIKVAGDDENNARYATEWKLNLEVEREKDNVRVGSLAVTPTEISCGGSVQISAEAVNYGSDRQRHAALTLENKNLGIDQRFELELESGSDEDYSIVKTVSVEIPPGVAAGTYPLKATAYYDYNRGANYKTVDLKVSKCEVPSSTNEVEEEREEEVAAPAGASPAADGGSLDESPAEASSAELVSSSAVAETMENPFTAEDLIVIILSAAIVLVLALIVLFALILLK